VTNAEGAGVIEAPRGTLLHHYWVDEDGKNVTEGALNRTEVAIRAYDPCLSCSTHAVGQMPLELVFVDAAGDEVGRCARE
jgi:NAD-reducing hydrogenase large subunit